MAEASPDSPNVQHVIATVQDLLALADEDFVRGAYRALLGREADEGGFAAYLSHVRQGADKAQLVVVIAQSPEGQQRSHSLTGLDALIASRAVPRRSLARRVMHRLIAPFRGPSPEPLERAMRAIDNRLYRIEEQLHRQYGALASVPAIGIRLEHIEAQFQQQSGTMALVPAIDIRLGGIGATLQHHFGDLDRLNGELGRVRLDLQTLQATQADLALLARSAARAASPAPLPLHVSAAAQHAPAEALPPRQVPPRVETLLRSLLRLRTRRSTAQP